jgi:hypothetical protein
MRPQPEIIHLGAHEWCIRPLTLAQVQAIEPILMATQQTKNNVKAAIEIVAIALSRDHASVVEGLSEIEATASEIAAAMTCVLRLGGFIETRQGANPVGEAQADAIQSENPSASISTSSMRG